MLIYNMSAEAVTTYPLKNKMMIDLLRWIEENAICPDTLCIKNHTSLIENIIESIQTEFEKYIYIYDVQTHIKYRILEKIQKYKYERKDWEGAAIFGDLESMYKVGINYENSGNIEKAYHWFEKGHTKNHFGCSVKFANYCHNGTGCEADQQKAGEIYKKISKKMMEDQEGYLKDSVSEACYNYGMMLMKGEQSEIDRSKGLKYIEYAEKKGWGKATTKLLSFDNLMREWEKNEEENEEGDEEDASDKEENADY